jgi:hypothetical protein
MDNVNICIYDTNLIRWGSFSKYQYEYNCTIIEIEIINSNIVVDDLSNIISQPNSLFNIYIYDIFDFINISILLFFISVNIIIDIIQHINHILSVIFLLPFFPIYLPILNNANDEHIGNIIIILYILFLFPFFPLSPFLLFLGSPFFPQLRWVEGCYFSFSVTHRVVGVLVFFCFYTPYPLGTKYPGVPLEPRKSEFLRFIIIIFI